MKEYITLVVAMILLPASYWGIMTLWQSWLRQESEGDEQKESMVKGRQHFPFLTLPELAVLLSAEAALFCIWQNLGRCSWDSVRFQLLFVMLAGMTVFCITDYRERIVPNRILLLLLLLFFLILGYQGIRGMDIVVGMLPAIVLGLLFSLITFGLGYLISHGGMGAGDVKLALVMGLYLTGEYVPGAVFYGCMAGAVYALVQMFRKKLSRKDQLPFVPFLYVGLIIRYIL